MLLKKRYAFVLLILLGSCASQRKYIVAFDIENDKVANTRANQLVFNSIKDKYSQKDSIYISLSYPYVSKRIQFSNIVLFVDLEQKLKNMLDSTLVLPINKIDNRSYFKGTFHKEKKNLKWSERILLIRVKNK